MDHINTGLPAFQFRKYLRVYQFPVSGLPMYEQPYPGPGRILYLKRQTVFWDR